MNSKQHNEINEIKQNKEIQETKKLIGNYENRTSEPIQNEPQPQKSNLSTTINMPILRESQLPKVFPLSNVFVNFPKSQTSFMKTIMHYKIEFYWNGQKKSIERRYSDIQNLREAFASLLPFTYICPIHRKQIMVIS